MVIDHCDKGSTGSLREDVDAWANFVKDACAMDPRIMAKSIKCLERARGGSAREVNEVRKVSGERLRVQTNSGALDTAGPKQFAKALKMTSVLMPKKA